MLNTELDLNRSVQHMKINGGKMSVNATESLNKKIKISSQVRIGAIDMTIDFELIKKTV